jgi:phosphoglycerate dehydrogenase-like enzyme
LLDILTALPCMVMNFRLMVAALASIRGVDQPDLGRRDRGAVRELDLMKENAILINVARGEIIDEGALYAHLISHPHFFAGIDAWWVEPVRHGHFAMGYPFLDLPNVIGSPHNSAGGGAWRDEYLRRAVQNCRRAILGETPRNLIGPDERML